MKYCTWADAKCKKAARLVLSRYSSMIFSAFLLNLCFNFKPQSSSFQVFFPSAKRCLEGLHQNPIFQPAAQPGGPTHPDQPGWGRAPPRETASRITQLGSGEGMNKCISQDFAAGALPKKFLGIFPPQVKSMIHLLNRK